MYRKPSEPARPHDRVDAETIADELRERALRLTRWLGRASLAIAIATGLATFAALYADGMRQPLKLAYLLVSLTVFGAARAIARWFVRRRVDAWVALAAREHRVDGGEVWRRIWAGFY